MNTGTAWLALLIAGLLEVVWATSMKYSAGFTRLWPSVVTVVVMLVSFVLLSRSMQSLPLGTAYAVWTGIGAVGSALVGMLLFHEARDPFRLLCVLMIVLGIAGLRFTSAD